MDSTRCGFCQNLPEGSAGSGKTMCCPLCKSPLVEKDGQCYRLIAEAVPRGSGRSRKRALTLAALAVGLAFAGLLLAHFAKNIPEGKKIQANRLPKPPPKDTELRLAWSTGPVISNAMPRVKDTEKADLAQENSKPRTYPPPPPPPAPVTPPLAKVKPASLASLALVQAAQESKRPNKADWIGGVPASQLRQQLLTVSEVALVSAANARKDSDDMAAKARAFMKNHLQKIAKEAEEKGPKRKPLPPPEEFIHWVRANRAELTGLPFLLGKECQLAQGANLGLAADRVRTKLDEAFRQRPALWNSPKVSATEVFWAALTGSQEFGQLPESRPDPPEPKAYLFPALLQILGPEANGFRRGLVDYLSRDNGAEATRALVKHVLFDIDADVRYAAMLALRERPQESYTPLLLDGLGYPWAAVARHAAEALAFFERTDLVPKLVDLLDQPDPTAPFDKMQAGKKISVVREMVRINHHRNCLLCHAASDGRVLGQVLGRVPDPDQELPPSLSVQYYGFGQGDVFVAADITYLRQDFSVLQPVKNHGKWPHLQRFDFLVRTRLATTDDHRHWQTVQDKEGQGQLSEHKRALIGALQHLTGLPLGVARSEVWRRALPAERATSWFSPCLK